MQDLQTQDWYELLVDDCKAIITEAVFTSRYALVEGYWQLGQRIREDKQVREYAKGNQKYLALLSKDIGLGSRTIYNSLALYDKYPDISELPEGKNTTWHKLITKYLPKNSQTQERAEQIFENFASKKQIKIERGLPDYMVVKDGEVVGFVEVKRDDLQDELRKNQILFMKFCKKHNIPYQVWSPVMANKRFNESNNHEYKNRMRYANDDIWNKI